MPTPPSPSAASRGSTARSAPAQDPVSRGLGLASLALSAPLAAPAAVARAIGVTPGGARSGVLRLVGARELAAGAGLLRRGGPGWLWGRVAGDAADLALLGRSLAAGRNPRTLAAAAAVAGITAVDVWAAATRGRAGGAGEVELRASTTVRKDPRAVYDVWHRFEQLPTFMAHLDRVEVTGPTTSRWTATAPFGRTVTWEAETTEDAPGERIAWRSREGTPVPNSGEVVFRPAPGDRGTEVRVTLRYAVPGGALGRAVARYFGEEPHQQLDDDLRRFKQVVETGEVVRSDGAPGGKKARSEFPQHAAQPLSAEELEEVRP